MALDLGMGRAWSAAVACWPNGRVEATAIAPGIPSIAAQERRDAVPAGTYQRLVNAGSLHVAEGLHVPPVPMLVGMVAPWMPRAVVADTFRWPDLKDAKVRHLVLRRPRYKESTTDIRGLRRMALDGTLAVDPASRDLLFVSLTAGRVVNDEDGNVRFQKRGTNNKARDDVAQALIFSGIRLARSRC